MKIQKYILYTIITLTLLLSGSFTQAALKLTTPLKIDQSGLVGWWTFDGKDTIWTSGTAGTVVDESRSGNTGTMTNMARSSAQTIGKLGQAMKFDGVDDYVVTSSIGTLGVLGNVTVSVWAKYRTLSVGTSGSLKNSLYGSGEASDLEADNVLNNLSLDSDKKMLAFWEYNAGTNVPVLSSSAASVNQDQWNLYTYTRDVTADTVTFFVNGRQLGDVVSYTNDPTGGGSGKGFIGRVGTGSSSDFDWDGSVDDVRVYNRALSATEVLRLYNAGSSKINVTPTSVLTSGIVGWWTFDGSKITDKVYDSSGQGNNGYIYNAATTSAKVIGKLGQGLRFDGVDDYVNIGNGPTLTSGVPFSIGWWEKISTNVGGTIYPSRFRLIVDNNSSNNGFIVIRSNDGNYAPISWGGANSIGNTFFVKAAGAPTISSSINIWHHFVLTGTNPSSNTAGNFNLYVDGVSYATSAAGVGNSINNTTNRIGYDGIDTASNTVLDDVRVYNRALTSTEVLRLYNMGK